MKEKIDIAVVTGEHPFDVPAFHRLFCSMPEINYYPQHLDQFVRDWGKVRTRYDVVLFYNWHQDTPPGNERGWWHQGTKEALEEICETGQGIVILHHAIGAFPKWEFWSELVGRNHRPFTVDQFFAWFDEGFVVFDNLHMKIADPVHPITLGLDDCDIPSETWGSSIGNPISDCHILMTTDHPKMELKAMAWIHQYKKARVFCLQPGHDNASYVNPNFRTMLSRGIQWVSGHL